MQRKASEIWLGDVTRIVWLCEDKPFGVSLMGRGLKVTLDFRGFAREECVEIMEWLRWGTSANEENWPKVCHLFALPRRGPITRQLRPTERRWTRRLWDRGGMVAAMLLLVGGGAGWWWSGHPEWMIPLMLVPAAWMTRFALPSEGVIAWKAPRMPRFFAQLAPVLIMMALSGGMVATMFRAKPTADWAGFGLLVCGIVTIALLIKFAQANTAFTKLNEPLWIAASVATWNVEARTGAWALGRESRQLPGAISASDS